MKLTFIKLHIAILFAGLGSILGKLITLNEGLIVWWRMLFASIVFFAFLLITKKMQKIPMKDFILIAFTGALLGLHWVFFFGSIKASNISIGVVCFSLVGFFTAILEPILLKQKFVYREFIYSLIVLVGILLIFSFDTRYRTGIIIGIISSIFYSLASIWTKKNSNLCQPSIMLMYQMFGGVIVLTCLLPAYLYLYPVSTIIPGITDFAYLIMLSLFRTIILQLFNIQVLKKVSAFTVNLSYNLDPIYSIIAAILFFNEGRELNFAFYIGVSLLLASVLLQAWNTIRLNKLNSKVANNEVEKTQ